MALEDTAVRLIASKGRSVTLLRKSVTPADTDAPWDGAATEGVAESIAGVFTAFSDEQIDGTTIKQGDQQVIVAAKATADISTEDTIVDGARRWRIVSASLVKPGLTAYIWKLQVRS